MASGSDFMANASSDKPGKLKKLVIEPKGEHEMIVLHAMGVEVIRRVTVRNHHRFVWQIDSLDLTDKDLTRRSSLRRGLTMFVISRSLAAISWSIGVNRKKLSRLTRQISTSGRCASNFSRCRAA